MSRLTMSPFHKPSPFEFPRVPLSPPETHSDAVLGPLHIPSSSMYTLAGQDLGMPDSGPSNPNPDTQSRVKRTSSIQYHHTPINPRESKDRITPRNGKTLILVIPPAALIQDHGRLSAGPYHRLAQGVVMPLLPSMFSQLTAIAREFNFPSTTGLCLYYHYIEEGLTLTPRISDDSWQTLWAHLSEPLLQNEKRPLIGGKVEFDIDLRLARWYTAWLSALHRENLEQSILYPSTAPSIGHHRGDSNATAGHPFEGDNAEIHQHSAPVTTRHVPRKLSLVERYDSMSTQGELKHNVGLTQSPPEVNSGQTRILSPIVQEEEPQTARQYLDNRVNSWRASAVITSPLAATGQTSLDPSNLPNNIPIDSLLKVSESSPSAEDLNLEDFTWSVSSLGPPSPAELSPVSWYHAPSVHLANRLEGSVCSTPSFCTSFGPLDDEWIDLEAVYSRVASPDIAQRFCEDCPLTPVTATSWGPPLSYPPSPVAKYRIPTPDLAQRFYEECPPTPMTATSWGPPSSYPPSPRCTSPVPSLDIGERCQSDEFEPLVVYPRESTMANNVWLHVWPYNSGSSTEALKEPEEKTIPTSHWSHVWPYTAALPSNSQPVDAFPSRHWSHVWPYNSKGSKKPTSIPETETVPSKGGSHVWLYNSATSKGALCAQEGSISRSDESEALGGYRQSFVYPYVHIYPPVSLYPDIEIYPEVSRSNIYDSYAVQEKETSIDVRLPHRYPLFDICALVYPHNLESIYPAVSMLDTPHTQLGEGYPYLSIYPAIDGPRFSHFSLYTYNPRTQYPTFEIYPGTTRSVITSTVKDETPETVHSRKYLVSTITVYPRFNLYPAVEKLLERTKFPKPQSCPSVHLQKYPVFNIYPPVYPHFDLYPVVTRSSEENISGTSWLSVPPVSKTCYPTFNLYPAIYPYFDLYPVAHSVLLPTPAKTVEKRHGSLSTIISPTYPTFNLYPSVYPHLVIYPAPYGTISEQSHGKDVWRDLDSISSSYPCFNLYPSVYPYIQIYPVPYDFPSSKDTSVEIHFSHARYPYFNLYPGVYPNLDVYPSAPFIIPIKAPTSLESSTESGNRRNAWYPFFNLYPAVYPHFDLYPAQYVYISPPQQRSKSSTRLTHAELHAMVMMEHGLELSNLHGMSEGTAISATSNSNTISRNSPIGSTISRFREPGRFSTPLRSGSTIFLPSSPSQNLRKSINLQGFDIQRSSNLQEPASSRSSIALKSSPRRRDSLISQRVRAFDNQVASSTGLSRDTISKFPMPPRVPLPPLPMDRGH